MFQKFPQNLRKNFHNYLWKICSNLKQRHINPPLSRRGEQVEVSSIKQKCLLNDGNILEVWHRKAEHILHAVYTRIRTNRKTRVFVGCSLGSLKLETPFDHLVGNNVRYNHIYGGQSMQFVSHTFSFAIAAHLESERVKGLWK